MSLQRQNTAIHLATKQRKYKMVQLLGSLGADCNKENEVHDCTATMF